MIRVEKLTKFFSRHRSLFRRERMVALREVTFTVERGSLVVILGPNGAGKTTLLKIIAGLIRPDEGEVWVEDHSWDHPERIHACVGMVTSYPRGFYPRLSGLENLRVFGATHGLYGKKLRLRISEIAQRMGLVPVLDVRYQELSQGMKSRLGFARALLHDPPLLLLDEPFQSIDSEMMEDLRRWIFEDLVLQQNRTVLFVSHRHEEFLGWRGRLLFMRAGRVSGEARIEDFTKVLQERMVSL